jgi:hypothetical protein
LCTAIPSRVAILAARSWNVSLPVICTRAAVLLCRDTQCALQALITLVLHDDPRTGIAEGLYAIHSAVDHHEARSIDFDSQSSEDEGALIGDLLPLDSILTRSLAL